MPSKLPVMLGGALQVILFSLVLAACDITNPPFPIGPKPPEVVTPLPTVLPARDVAWLTQLISATETITITGRDTPDLLLRVDQTMRDRLVAAVKGHTTAAAYGDAWHTLRRPYPQYLLVFGSGESPTTLYWVGPGHISVAFAGTNGGYEFTANYQQADDALWNTVQDIAPPPPYSPDNLRYLLQSSFATCTRDGQIYRHDGLTALDLARWLAVSTPAPADEQVAGVEPQAVLDFVVDGRTHQVEVWDEALRYAGRVYKLRELPKMIAWACEPSKPGLAP